MENYEILSQIGKGNFGSIYKIIRKSDSKVMVWKELDYSRMTEKEKQQIVTEVNIIRELKHPHIVRYYDRILDKKNSKIYIIMEYCEGGDLNQIIKRCKKTSDFLQEDVLWKIFTQMVLAISACHNRSEGKILHRDIKPSNVFLDNENNIKLGDFGLSRMLSNESNFAYSHVGTPYYMSPEQIDELRYNDKSDIWSLGCFLYELTTFTPPFQAKNHVDLAMKIKAGKLEKIPNRYSEELWRVIVWMMNVNQNNRPSIDDLINLPQVVLRLRERRLKDNLSKIKRIEDNLKKKEEELNEKEKELENREKELLDKENKLNEKEIALNDLSKKIANLNYQNALHSSSSNTISNANTNANTNMNSMNNIANYISNSNVKWEDFETNYSSRVVLGDDNNRDVYKGSQLYNEYQYNYSTEKPKLVNRNNDLRQISYEIGMENNNNKTNRLASFKFDPNLYCDKSENSFLDPNYQLATNREVILTNTSNSSKNIHHTQSNQYYYQNKRLTNCLSSQSQNNNIPSTANSQNIKSRKVMAQKRAGTPKMGTSTENISKSHQRSGSYSSKYVQKSVCSINSVIDKNNKQIPLSQYKKTIQK